MKLIQIRISNFYGFAEQTTINLSDLTVLVGRNDAGKSSILKALDYFLSDKTPSQETKNLHNSSNQMEISAVFEPCSQEIIIDETISTTFEAEELVDEDGYLCIRKTWDMSVSKPKPQVCIRRKIYETDDFLSLTETQLMRLCQKYSLPTQKGNGEAFNNVEKRSKLRERFCEQEIGYTYDWETLPTTGTSSRQKQIFDAIKLALPKFELFKADTSLSETDTVIQNYFRDIAHRALVEAGMLEKEEIIRQRLSSVVDSITSKMNAAMPSNDAVNASTDFDWKKVVNVSFITSAEDTSIPLSMRGDGFRRTAMMAYFEHLAEERNSETNGIIFGFEEPETYLHPKAQEQLFEKLQDMSEGSYQVIICTHSPIIVARSDRSCLVHVVKDGQQTRISSNGSSIKSIAEDLGISVQNQFIELFDQAKALLLVEGIDDANAFTYVSKKYKEAGQIERSFEDLDIILVPIGGCQSIKHWVALDLLKKLSKPFFVILDSDIKQENVPSQNRIDMQSLGFAEGKHFHVLRKRALENYIPCSSLNSFVPNANLTYGDWDDVKSICKSHRLNGHLGGKGVVDRHFDKLSFEELRQSFCGSSNEDEFLAIYSCVLRLVN